MYVILNNCTNSKCSPYSLIKVTKIFTSQFMYIFVTNIYWEGINNGL
jgi:hypothetical protein